MAIGGCANCELLIVLEKFAFQLIAFLDILNTLHYNKNMIIREKYLSKIRQFYDSDLIKIITGIRRCGKSVVMQQIRDEIAKKSDNIYYFEFENRLTKNEFSNTDTIINHILKNKKEGMCYVFFDEIQDYDGWEDICKTLRLKNCSIFITGSNQKLLSKEYTKKLSGRYVSFKIYPFVYKEILQYCKELNREVNELDYIIWGGFPKRFEFQDENAMKTYLKDLNETIIYNDLSLRYKIKKIELFEKVVNFIFLSNSRILSSNSIYKYIKEQHKCSENTIAKYIYYLEQAFAIEKLKQYSTKTKQELSFYNKIYNEDVSFNSIRQTNNRFDLTHNLENIVYNELIYMGYNLNVYIINNKEVDFLATNGNKKYYIQVAYSVENNDTYEREMLPFNIIKDNISQKILITNDDLDYSTSLVRHIKLKDFLRFKSLDDK